jgi:hypothetical protein
MAAMTKNNNFGQKRLPSQGSLTTLTIKLAITAILSDGI